jgi:hypothetical protein
MATALSGTIIAASTCVGAFAPSNVGMRPAGQRPRLFGFDCSNPRSCALAYWRINMRPLFEVEPTHPVNAQEDGIGDVHLISVPLGVKGIK